MSFLPLLSLLGIFKQSVYLICYYPAPHFMQISNVNALEEGLDVIPSSQNEEETVQVSNVESMDTAETTVTGSNAMSTMVTRVECSQPKTAAPLFEVLPLSSTPPSKPTAAPDTMPFTQSQAPSTSLVIDTENMDPEATQSSIFITGSNLSATEVVS